LKWAGAEAAGNLLADSLLPRRRSSWSRIFSAPAGCPDTLRLPGGTSLTTVVVDGATGPNLAVTPESLLRAREGGQERATVTAGVLTGRRRPPATCRFTSDRWPGGAGPAHQRGGECLGVGDVRAGDPSRRPALDRAAR
jgi:hypothetical protein